MTAGAAKHIGVVLSGCGFLDGAEIHEAVLTLLALDRAGARVTAVAPDLEQHDVVDHHASRPLSERRNALREAARIARGEIESLTNVSAADFDALILPGGYGAAKTLSTFAVDGERLRVLPDLARLLRDLHAARKPMGFICIAPVLAAKLFGDLHPRLTIGDDRDTAAALQALGAKHVECRVDEIVVDESHKLVSTPAYMLGPSIARVADGIDKLVAKVLAMA